MKKLNYLLSMVLVPALTLQAGGSASCPSGSGGSTPATPTLPKAVSGIQTINGVGAATSYTFTVGSSLTSVTPFGNTVFKLGGVYGVWCTFPSATVPGGGNGSPAVSNPTTVYTPYDYSQYTTSTAGGSFGTAGTALYEPVAGGGTFTGPMLTLTAEWNAVNWILNNYSGLGATAADTQAAIWQILHGEAYTPWVYTNGIPGTSLTPVSASLYLAALQNTSYVPGPGSVVAVLMVPTTPTSAKNPYQGFIVPVPIACTATGSVSFTKTANVTTANAFQTVTYTYTVRNTGSTTLQNIIITDDNGTPAYTGDDVQIVVPGTLAPGATYSVNSTVYLPISLFYQSGNSAAFDTLIPQIPASPANALLLTYLIDSDVSDNTYGTGASAGWAGVGGHTFAEELGNYAEFAFYDAKGNLVSDFNADYISSVGTFPSGYGSSGVIGKPIYGGVTYIDSITSTLADNLNGFTKFNGDTTNSPVGDVNWQSISGYKVTVDKGIFGVFGMGSATVKKDYLTAVETAYSGKCGSPISATYTPTIVCSKVTGTAYLCATVCGCSTVIHACAKTCVTLNGNKQPTCNSAPAHNCQAPKCTCTCSQCQAGNHSGCTHVGCTDPICHANNCAHNTVICKTTQAVYCW